ncbi:hypothetical protein M406DRAFT_341475 [Cryphonectria parasitica EP155]|uniref:Aminoacyl-transfer RNA synthetases class-II family profile domain-containing protein n=1 Tax=Cryphonectria parasitica (strain ATCC 38755 / EP155) TaxID=660469 RepID=A0A9P4XWG1_CRYP1|nr:uncharacterized protein M406DRAFT_341475 [Cryphonectria parasitica EP155]KAF3762209.1 hypothetical protein M406DRAFT_341475 [Cryphonectria parasitica EP155]
MDSTNVSFFDFPPQSPAKDFEEGQLITVHGFLSKRRDLSKKMTFVDLLVDAGPSFQFKSAWEEKESPEHEAHKTLRSFSAWSPVALTGRIDKYRTVSSGMFSPDFPAGRDKYELTLQGQPRLLNHFPQNIIISEGALFPPQSRHLQLRFDKVLQDRLKFRDQLVSEAQDFLRQAGFLHVETPILFKSTPEGAREFLVPTRRPGYAYALPQSPQQYKQMLMASGVRRYFQLARCFRDEDLRADRQPEFTQLDLEMSFATGKDVMQLIESLVKSLYAFIRRNWRTFEVNGQMGVTSRMPDAVDSSSDIIIGQFPSLSSEDGYEGGKPFPRITYHEAMSLYGSDKPDLRIPNKIQRVDHLLSPAFVSMISDLEDPIVEACVFRFQDTPDVTIPDFVTSVWDKLPKPLGKNPDGQPVPIIIDSRRPLSGLSSLGHEAAAELLASDLPPPLGGPLQEGDVLVIQARPNKPFSGGSTALGTLRNHIYQLAVQKHLLPFDPTFQFLWVTDFPLFTPTDPATTSDPGQGGAAGFSSTHHPFTAPLHPEDFDLLHTNPLRARADHYDLVVNGVELGGGSRRIHVAAVQEYVFREVLQMDGAGIEHFSHLLEALRAGCPPHAGFAIGWDRLVATLSYTGSVRDVIAFPKSKQGDEPVARCPGKVGREEWEVYHLQPREKKDVEG